MPGDPDKENPKKVKQQCFWISIRDWFNSSKDKIAIWNSKTRDPIIENGKLTVRAIKDYIRNKFSEIGKQNLNEDNQDFKIIIGYGTDNDFGKFNPLVKNFTDHFGVRIRIFNLGIEGLALGQCYKGLYDNECTSNRDYDFGDNTDKAKDIYLTSSGSHFELITSMEVNGIKYKLGENITEEISQSKQYYNNEGKLVQLEALTEEEKLEIQYQQGFEQALFNSILSYSDLKTTIKDSLISYKPVSLLSGNLLRKIDNTSDIDDTLKVVSYNVENRNFANSIDKNEDKSYYTNVDLSLLPTTEEEKEEKSKKRAEIIRKELFRLRADIICLQECITEDLSVINEELKGDYDFGPKDNTKTQLIFFGKRIDWKTQFM